MTGKFYKSIDGKTYMTLISCRGELVKLTTNSFEELLVMLNNHLKGSPGWVPIGQIKLEEEETESN